MSTRRLNDPKFLVGYWGLQSNALDASGYGNDGTWSGTEAYVDGPFGKTVGSFNGSSSVSASHNARLQDASTFTLSALVNTNSVSGARYILSKGSGTTDANYAVLQFGADIELWGTRSGGASGWGKIVEASSVLTVGQWAHIVIVQDGANPFIVVNGDYHDTSAVAVTTATNTASVEIGAFVGSSQWNGEIGNVRVYAGTAMTYDECIALYRSER